MVSLFGEKVPKQVKRNLDKAGEYLKKGEEGAYCAAENLCWAANEYKKRGNIKEADKIYREAVQRLIPLMKKLEKEGIIMDGGHPPVNTAYNCMVGIARALGSMTNPTEDERNMQTEMNRRSSYLMIKDLKEETDEALKNQARKGAYELNRAADSALILMKLCARDAKLDDAKHYARLAIQFSDAALAKSLSGPEEPIERSINGMLITNRPPAELFFGSTPFAVEIAQHMDIDIAYNHAIKVSSDAIENCSAIGLDDEAESNKERIAVLRARLASEWDKYSRKSHANKPEAT